MEGTKTRGTSKKMPPAEKSKRNTGAIKMPTECGTHDHSLLVTDGRIKNMPMACRNSGCGSLSSYYSHLSSFSDSPTNIWMHALSRCSTQVSAATRSVLPSLVPTVVEVCSTQDVLKRAQVSRTPARVLEREHTNLQQPLTAITIHSDHLQHKNHHSDTHEFHKKSKRKERCTGGKKRSTCKEKERSPAKTENRTNAADIPIHRALNAPKSVL